MQRKIEFTFQTIIIHYPLTSKACSLSSFFSVPFTNDLSLACCHDPCITSGAARWLLCVEGRLFLIDSQCLNRLHYGVVYNTPMVGTGVWHLLATITSEGGSEIIGVKWGVARGYILHAGVNGMRTSYSQVTEMIFRVY